MKLAAMALIITALFLLVIPGVLANAMSSSDLINGQNGVGSFALTCQALNNDPTCQGSQSIGCQVANSVCTLSGSAISFLNQNSPFTQLINGNVLGLFANLNTAGTSSGNQLNSMFSGTGTTNFIYVDCGVTPNVNGKGLQNWAIAHCTQTDIDNGNLTEAKVNTWNNFNPTLAGATISLQFFSLGNGTFPMTCSWDVQINYTAVAGNGWTYYGCTVSKGSNISTHARWPFLVAVNNNLGALAAGYQHKFVFVQVETWITQGCAGNGIGGQDHSNQCDSWAKSFLGFNIPGTTTSFVPNGGSPVILFFVGLVLFLIGIGISFSTSGSVLASGGGAGVGFNAQGTRLAQALGLGLLAWAPLYSEFSTWFTTGLLPYGLDGSITSIASGTGVVAFFLTGVFFAGVFWLMFSLSD